MKKFMLLLIILLIPCTVFAQELEPMGTSPIAGNITNVSTEAGCPLGADVTEDLSGALRIIKIVAPLLIIGLTIKEGLQYIVQKGVEENSKKFVTRLMKRIGAAALLFAIPTIVDATMQLLNIWDETGKCKIDETVKTPENLNTASITTYSKTVVIPDVTVETQEPVIIIN